MGQTTLAFWQLLLIAVGPATLTAVVAVLAPLILEGRKQEAERKKRRAEKLEELIGKVYEYDTWVDYNIKNNALGEKNVIGITPLSGLEAISSLYFPQFEAQISEVVTRARSYLKWSIEAGDRRLQQQQNYLTDMSQHYRPYHAALKTLLKDLSRYAKTEFT